MFSQPLVILSKTLFSFLRAIRKKHVEDVIFDEVTPPTAANFDEILEVDASAEYRR